MVQRAPAAGGVSSRLRTLSDVVRALEARVRQGGGPDKAARQHKQGKLTARERVDGLRDPGSRFIEIGLLVAYDQYDGQAPAAGGRTRLVPGCRGGGGGRAPRRAGKAG